MYIDILIITAIAENVRCLFFWQVVTEVHDMESYLVTLKKSFRIRFVSVKYNNVQKNRTAG